MGMGEWYRHLQWTVEIREGSNKYSIYKLGPNQEKQYYEVRAGEYGQPIIVAEPELAFDAPQYLLYLNAKKEEVRPDQKIAGIICQDGPRFSLTNAKSQGIEIKANVDGSIQIGDEKWWIATLFVKDAKRIIGYDAFCVRKERRYVNILELGDLITLF